MKRGLITNIQKCSIHDGPGIRTTIFFKGCSMKCSWCHNPETQSYIPEMMYNSEKCNLCGSCVKACSKNALTLKDEFIHLDSHLCSLCGKCIDYCINNTREIIGTQYTVSELMKEIEKDKIFYDESGGGVTLSGGEVMTQVDFVTDLVKRCKSKGISVAIDTCGHVNYESFEKILDYVDLFLYDIKIMDPLIHQKHTLVDNNLVLSNLEKLANDKANINIRIPLIEDINTDTDNIEKIIHLLKRLNLKKVNLLPYHNTGNHKYERLKMDYEKNLKAPSEEDLNYIKSIFEKNDFNVKIGG
ncbi:trans-4-hydroxy-L-proline dehydratase activase [Anaeromicrobium sediminis]|uniref:Radical SAM protein n=1 Tax=Anaeromicrobium sediminis TaxID=1478221 RepID=A0A267MI45_9FIRM|nr:trans-4-hydroxy-L-proline dehydratase activase [Anaeromicrobium sediminis]PAB59251.1 radical SAM protein [Anaeromicrobium sediminis]